MSKTREAEYEELIINAGRQTGSAILCGSIDSCESDGERFQMADVIVQASVHIQAVSYFNEVVAGMKKSGPVPEDQFFETLKGKIRAEVKEIEKNMKLAAGQLPQ